MKPLPPFFAVQHIGDRWLVVAPSEYTFTRTLERRELRLGDAAPVLLEERGGATVRPYTALSALGRSLKVTVGDLVSLIQIKFSNEASRIDSLGATLTTTFSTWRPLLRPPPTPSGCRPPRRPELALSNAVEPP